MLTCQAADGQISIAGKLQVHFLDAIMDCLGTAINQASPLRVDLSQVTEVDLAGLQLLLAFLKGRQADAPTTLEGVQPFMEKALEVSGLDNFFAAYLN